ncbi:SDR family NAD(P)-dependent oxidoreductase [Paenibacillus terreus]|uniref:SDR family NAD(P)-dependent oxidoreductase n=1 Tax=Paenibacillus terreus TaxID=1387834 RepID=A0ABV5B502_9BACL
MTKPLQGKIAVVAGATRGAGRTIAVTLGAAGATVYCTGRSIRGQASDLNRPETIEDTADMINARGGRGIPVQVDHTREEQVKALFERIRQEQQGIAALAADPDIMSKSGRTLASWDLSDEYGFVDVDGRKPHWGNYAKQHGFL